MLINLLTALPTTQFSGQCRYESTTGEQTFSQLKRERETARSAEHCYKKCKEYDGTNNEKCMAFAFETKESENCDLFKDGPYTEGNLVANIMCYIMPEGNLVFIIAIHEG